MGDLEERALWRKAIEEFPDVVRWIEAKLRGLASQQSIPKFEQSFLSTPLIVTPFATNNVPIFTTRESDFKVVGISAFLAMYPKEILESLRAAPAHITIGYANHVELRTQPLGVLLSTSSEPPFVPGWVTDLTLPRATRIEFQYSNPTDQTIVIRFAIHGSSTSITPVIPETSLEDDFRTLGIIE